MEQDADNNPDGIGLIALVVSIVKGWESVIDALGVLPRAFGMVFVGLGWLRFASASLARLLSPYNFAPGIIGEGALTVWLLMMGVKEKQWMQQAVLGSQSDGS